MQDKINALTMKNQRQQPAAAYQQPVSFARFFVTIALGFSPLIIVAKSSENEYYERNETYICGNIHKEL